MKQLKYKTQIHASPDKVWDTLWNDGTYRKWTAAMQEGMWYEGSLAEGSTVKMFDPENNGMYSLVVRNLPAREMTFRHLGWLYDGVESPQAWEDATESYLLEAADGGTLLSAEIRTLDEFVGFYDRSLPNALEKVKEIAEQI